jgi:hypothetical protein
VPAARPWTEQRGERLGEREDGLLGFISSIFGGPQNVWQFFFVAAEYYRTFYGSHAENKELVSATK